MIYLILALGFVLRIFNINQSLWLDEASQAILSEKSLYSIWFERTGDFHPPLSYILSHFWMMVSVNDIWLRILPLLFGVLGIYILYLLTKDLFNKRIALIVSFLLGISPYHIYYSQEFRMYAEVTFFVLLSLYYFRKLLIKNKFWDVVLFVLSTTLVMYTHYLGGLIVLVELVYCFWFYRKSLKRFVLSLVGVLVLYLPWIPQLLIQYQKGGRPDEILPGWSSLLSADFIKALPLTLIKFSIGRIDFENQIFYFGVTLIVFLVLGYISFYSIKEWEKKEYKLVLLWLVAPISVSLLISFVTPLYQPFRLLFVLPAFYLFLGVGISKMKNIYLGLGLMILISGFGLFNYYLNSSFWREDWRGAVGVINSKVSDKDLVAFAWNEPFSPYEWYKGKNGVGVVSNPPADLEQVKRLDVLGEKRIFLFEYLQVLTDPKKEINSYLLQNNFREINKYNFNGVGFVTEYSNF